MKKPLLIWYLVLVTTALSTESFSQSKKYYFLHPENDFGSDLVFNPATLIINGSYDILRNGSRTKDVTAIAYPTGINNVIRNLLHPFKAIKEFGFDEFIAHEVFPLKGDINYVQYVPNYATHVVGHGMQFVKTAEWYDYHEFRFPRLYSVVTTSFYQLMNEAIENDTWEDNNIDAIADLLIFNPLGIILFSTNSGKKFFSETFPVYDWSLQPMFNPKNNFLENAGQQYAMKYNLPFNKNVKGLFFWGIQAMAGFSYRQSNGDSYSFATGIVVNNLKEKRINKARYLAPWCDGAVAFFFDRNNSLLSSIIVSGPRMYNCRVNIFPGFIKSKFLRFGMYLGLGEWDQFIFGVTVIPFPVGIVGS